MALTQKNRLLSISTPLGDDAMQLVSFSGQEEMSRLFRFHLELIADDSGIRPEDLVGQNVTFAIQMPDD